MQSHNYLDPKKLTIRRLAKNTSQFEHVPDHFKLRLILKYKSRKY